MLKRATEETPLPYTIEHSCEKTVYIPGISRKENKDKFYLSMEIQLSGTKISGYGWLLDELPTDKDIEDYKNDCWHEFFNH